MDSEGSDITALRVALDIVTDAILPLHKSGDNENGNNNETTTAGVFPILLGPPWSSLCAMTAPTLSTNHFGQISSSATSDELSEHDTYPTFYRTTPSGLWCIYEYTYTVYDEALYECTVLYL